MAHAAPDGYVGAPFGCVAADKVGDVGVQAVEGFQAWVRIGAGETQFEAVSQALS